jgi:multidrug efflux pump subunit AcrB
VLGRPPSPRSGIPTQHQHTGAADHGRGVQQYHCACDPDGGVVRIKDIARAELGSKSADSLVRYNGRRGEAIFINQSPGANAIEVAAGVKKALKEIEPRLPEDVAYDVMYDTTVFVEAMIHKV